MSFGKTALTESKYPLSFGQDKEYMTKILELYRTAAIGEKNLHNSWSFNKDLQVSWRDFALPCM